MSGKPDYFRQYKDILRSSDGGFISKPEWTKIGDNFKKLSIYDENIPVKTSSGTTINSD